MTDLLVDTNGVYARSWYSCKEDPFQTVASAFKAILCLIDPEKTDTPIDRAMFAWDGGRKNDKKRAPRPPAYEDARNYLKEAIEAVLGSLNYSMEGEEADDVIATAAFESDADQVVIASCDKDLTQLKGGKISVYDHNARGFVSDREITSKWHVRRPSHVAIALAIQGDSTDNISGIKGWGPRRVETLFEKVKSDMPFDKVLEVVTSQIPEDKLQEFYDSLSLTLLNTGLEGVPKPVPFKFAHHSLLVDYGLEDCNYYYQDLIERLQA